MGFEEDSAARARKQLGFGALIALAALVVAVILNGVQASAARRDAERWYVHTYDVLLTAGQMRAALHASLRGERGYLLTGDDRTLGPYRQGRADAARIVPRLRALTADNPLQERNIDALDRGATRLFADLERDLALAEHGQRLLAAMPVRVLATRDHCEAVLQVLEQIETEEHKLLAARRATAAAAAERTERNERVLAGFGVLLLGLAGLAGVSAARSAAELRRVLVKLQHAATTDELTGLANRRFFFERLEAEASRAARSGAPMTVAIVDVDHFKQVNDLHGHPAGDEVLRIVAEVARATMRSSDVVARIGGEEFAILMPETGMTRARRGCERLREAVAARTMLMPGGVQAAITLSSGVALLRQGEAVDRLVARADTALYAAKDGGRNQVRLAA